MSRNIAKPFHTTLSIIDINTVQPKYKCFYTEDVQLFIKVIDEFKKPLDISNVNVKAFFINDGDDLRQDDRITITNAENGEFNIMVRKNYIRLGLNTVRVVLFDADQEVFLQPFQIHCISSEILDDSIIIADDDYNVRDEVSKVNSKIDTEVDKLESSLDIIANELDDHIANHPSGGGSGDVTKNYVDTQDTNLQNQINETNSQLETNAKKMNVSTTTKRPLVVFISDDTKKDDLNVLIPIFEEKGVLCNFACITQEVDKAGSSSLTTQELQNIVAEGHGMLSHSHTHRDLTLLSEEELHIEFIQNQSKYKEVFGENADSIAYPFGMWNETVIKVARKYFKSAFSTLKDGYLLNEDVLEQYAIVRDVLTYEMGASPRTLANLKPLIDRCKTEKKLLVYCIHASEFSGQYVNNQQLLKDTIDYIKSINVDIVRHDVALEEKGNVLDIGTFNTQYTKISKSGAIKSSNTKNIIENSNCFRDNNTRTFSTPLTDFNVGEISYNIVKNVDSTGFPENTGGLLITHYNMVDTEFNFQIYHPRASTKSYKRLWNKWGTPRWEAFVPNSSSVEISNDFLGGTTKALSAEKGKELKTELETITTEVGSITPKIAEPITYEQWLALSEDDKNNGYYAVIDFPDETPVDLSLDTDTNILKLKKADGTEIGTGVTLPTGGGSDLVLGETSTTAYAGDKGKIAYDHSQVAHAPATAQKNSDITKAEIEAKLTGVITTHSHSGGGSSFSRLKNHSWSVLGDSISNDNAYVSNQYWDYITERVGGMNTFNYGVSGERIADFLKRFNTINYSDIITVFGGVNDWGQENPTILGTLGDTSDNTFYGALNLLCSGLLNNFPKSLIVFITPIGNNGFPGFSVGKNSLGLLISDYAKAISDVCSKFKIPTIDACNKSMLNPEIPSVNGLYFVDGLHLNELGHEVISYMIENEIERHYIPNIAIIPVTGISVSSSININVDETKQLVVDFIPANATNKNVTLSTSDSNIVSVSNGAITGVNVGSATITVTSDDGGHSSQCVVTVAEASTINPGNVAPIFTLWTKLGDTTITDDYSCTINSASWGKGLETIINIDDGETYTFTATQNTCNLSFKNGDTNAGIASPNKLTKQDIIIPVGCTKIKITINNSEPNQECLMTDFSLIKKI